MIGGLQKVTLLDYPGKVACTVFLKGCNLRCPYCHNPTLIIPKEQTEDISDKELYSFLASRKGKLDGVCITGGEPTLHAELPDFIRCIREKGLSVKLDTNGTNPKMLRQLLREKMLDYVAMDIKNCPDRYAETCRVDVIEQVRESAELLMYGNADYEFRTTVCSPFHTPEEFEKIGKWLSGAKRYYIQPFVDSGNLLGSGVKMLSVSEIKALSEAVLPYIPAAKIRGI